MGDGTKENPFIREDVLEQIKKNSGTAEGLDLSGMFFEEGIDLSKLNLRDIILEEAFLENAHFEGSNLCGSHLEGAYLEFAHFEGAELHFAHLERALLWSAKISPDTRLENIDWGSYILWEEIAKSYFAAAITYRQLKTWHTNAGMYNIAGEFFFREMEAKRKAQSWKKEPASKLWSWATRLLCGYGERYGNVVVAALVIIFGLAVVYVYGGLNLAYAIYFSAVSFTALGYGSWAYTPPVDWVQGVGAAESFIGVFMIALFLVTFIRKMTR